MKLIIIVSALFLAYFSNGVNAMSCYGCSHWSGSCAAGEVPTPHECATKETKCYHIILSNIIHRYSITSNNLDPTQIVIHFHHQLVFNFCNKIGNHSTYLGLIDHGQTWMTI